MEILLTSMSKKEIKEDLGNKVRTFYKSYNNCPPWSSVFRFVVREKIKAYDEGYKTAKKEFENKVAT